MSGEQQQLIGSALEFLAKQQENVVIKNIIEDALEKIRIEKEKERKEKEVKEVQIITPSTTPAESHPVPVVTESTPEPTEVIPLPSVSVPEALTAPAEASPAVKVPPPSVTPEPETVDVAAVVSKKKPDYRGSQFYNSRFFIVPKRKQQSIVL